MEIRNVSLKEVDDSIVLSADCTLRHFGSDTIYFKFDKKYKDFIVADASPFAAALLVPAMKLGQDLIIEGAISEKLYRGMHEVMTIMLSWNIGLKPISIIASELKKDEYAPQKNASFFSGGVDSFYTYLKNKESGKEKINYFILANGYDISLDSTELWKTTRNIIQDIGRKEHIEIIEVESNVRRMIEPIIPWGFTHGGCLAALGLSLRKELKSIFIASSYHNDQMFPWGSHPDTDYLWSTETLSFHHDGADVNRVQKVGFIAEYPIVLENLRVCYLNKKNKFNCGQCDKCLRTMINLRIAGALERPKTLPHVIDLERLRNLSIEREHGAIYYKENLAALEKLGIDQPLQQAIRESLLNLTPEQSYAMDALTKIWFLDYYYNRGRLYDIVNFARKKLR